MKAWVLRDIGDIYLEEVDKACPENGEVLVSVRASGICGSDIPRIYQTGAHVQPLIPGHEFSGEVVEAGRGVNSRWLGKRVGVFPLIPCGNCIACQRRQYELCRGYSYLGSRRDGGFSEYVTVPEWNLIELPDKVSYEQAAMLEPMAVAVHAMRSALSGRNSKTDTIAICGLGTIGILLLMHLKAAGWNNIYAIGNKDFQRKAAERAGVDETYIYNERNGNVHQWLMAQTNGIGVDIFFECVGKAETITDAVWGTAPNGIVQLVGNPASNILLEKEIYWKILRNQLTVKGSWNSAFTHSQDDDWHYVMDRVQNGIIHPEWCITHCFPLEELEAGLLMMRDRTQECIKIMMVR